ncbi:MAG TPA: VCBS repeat-containing protein [Planctomycetota bacterium]|nr:VCBS repeat-containing protein [Planctomycetota bacterium]
MPALRFQKILISDERYESCGVFDVNNDGVLDIVCGAYWYPGPKFDKKYKVGPVKAEGEYFDDFSTIAMDVNGNGYQDFVTGGWWGGNVRWRENPQGDPQKEWITHEIGKTGNVETTRAWDVDGDGQLEIVPNTPSHPQKVFKLVRDRAGKGTGVFTEHVLYEKGLGHGLGFGDVDGDGRGELLFAKGYLKAPSGSPAEILAKPWEFHPVWDLGSASVPILCVDLNGDGVNELIVGQAHRYGLDWFEPKKSATGTVTWIKHPIDPFNSQYHDLIWADLDGDGQCELITGKRYRAHCGRDPGEYDGVGIYYFKWTGESFAKQVIDYGPVREGKGAGIHFQVVDLDGDGRLDIVAPGKDGLVWFKNLGFAENMGDV